MSEKLSSMTRTLAAVRDNTKIPVLSLIRSDPEGVAVMTKLTPDETRKPRYDRDKNLIIETPDTMSLRDGAEVIMSRKKEARNLMKMLPDLELIKQILVSAILAPKDLIHTELQIDFDTKILEPRLSSLLQQKIEKYLTSTYKIKSLLSKILEDTLFYTGSYPMVVIPENALDDLINHKSNYSMESIRSSIQRDFLPNGEMRPLGLLGSPNKRTSLDLSTNTSFESFIRHRQTVDPKRDYDSKVYLTLDGQALDTGVRVTDNHAVLRRPKIEAMITEYSAESILYKGEGVNFANGVSNESVIRENRITLNTENLQRTDSGKETRSADTLTDKDLMDMLYQSRNPTQDVIRVIKTQTQLKRKSAAEPLIMHWPSEAVIPVYVPGDEEHHVGYFCLVDESGHPLTEKSYRTLSGDLVKQSMNQPFSRSLTDNVAKQMNGSCFDCRNPLHMRRMIDTYTDVIEADLMARLRNGIYSSSARLASNQEVFRIMLARSLMGNYTQVLWIPKELMTYFAIEYDDDGVGVSLLHKSSVLGALRSALLFADVRQGLRNAAGQTVVDIKLDEDDIDPLKRIDQAYSAIMRTRQESVPWSVRSPADMSEYVGKYGYIFKYSGHPALPEMEINLTETSSNHVRPDSDLQDRLEKQHSLSFGVPHEMVDKFNEPEHATTVVNNNILMTKRVVQHQEKINPQLTDYCVKILRHSESFISEVTELLTSNFEEIVLTDKLRDLIEKDPDTKQRVVGITIRDLLNSLVIELPKPETVTHQNQMTDLEEYEKSLDKKLEQYFNSDIFKQETFGELANNVELMRAAIKAYYMRKEMDRMGMGTDLNDLFNFNETSENIGQETIYAETSEFVKRSINGLAKFIKEAEEFREASNRAAETLAVSGMDTGGGDSSGSSYDDTDTGDSGDDFPSFDDDFTGGEDTPPEGEGDPEGKEGESLGEDEPMSF